MTIYIDRQTDRGHVELPRWGSRSNHCIIDSDHNESPQGSQQEASLNPVEVSSNVLVRWMLAFFLLLQAQFHLADRVLSLIFSFLKVFFAVLGRLYAPCVVIGEKLPSSLYMAQKTYRKMHKACFKKFPVCKHCGSIWKFEDCNEGSGLHQRPKLCSFIV